MENFNNKQKIILGALAAILIIVVIIYVFKKNTTSTIYSGYDNLYLNDVGDNAVQQASSGDSTNEIGNKIFVHIAGEVQNPGVFEVDENSRIIDLINLAGGLTENGSIEDINLAYKVEDGQKIYIPSIEETKKAKEEIEQNETEYITNSSGAKIEGPSVIDDASKESIVNINTATQTELETLSGIGPSTAQKIIDYRNSNGKFKSIEDIKNVSGIGDVKFNTIKDSIKI
ncbi:MAG: helix-hairpin-helix domain-containing protein [Oscillospiraceae bacterium]|nr:helix-hairpin-helix domain-containing protein [Oscillospiraceae bacterium]